MCASWAGDGRFEFQKNMWNVYGCAGGGRLEFQKNMWNVCHMAGGGRLEFQKNMWKMLQRSHKVFGSGGNSIYSAFRCPKSPYNFVCVVISPEPVPVRTLQSSDRYPSLTQTRCPVLPAHSDRFDTESSSSSKRHIRYFEEWVHPKTFFFARPAYRL